MKKVKTALIISLVIFLVFAMIVSIILNSNYGKSNNTNTVIYNDSALHLLDNYIEEKDGYSVKELYYANILPLYNYYSGYINSTALIKRIENYVLEFLPYYNTNLKDLSSEELESYIENNKFYLIEIAGLTKVSELEEMKEPLSKITANFNNEWSGIEFIEETFVNNNESEEYFKCEFNIIYIIENTEEEQKLPITLYIRYKSSQDRPNYKFIVKEYSNEEK